MRKKFLFLASSLLTIAPLTTISCFNFLNNGTDLEKPNVDQLIKSNFKVKKTGFKNLTNLDYFIKSNSINLYFKDDENSQPYVDVEEIIKDLDGFFNTSLIKKSNDNNKLVLFNKNHKMEIDAESDNIFVSSGNFFNLVKSTSSTNYSRHLLFSGFKIENEYEINPSISFNLKKYNIDIIRKNERTYIPFSIFNTLFCSQNYYNLYYNGSRVFGQFFSFSEGDDNANQYRQGKFNNYSETEKDRKYNLDNLLFNLDYFYGLKKYKNINSFENYVDSLKHELLSTNPEIYNKAYAKLFFSKINELHTNFNFLNAFSNASKNVRDYAVGNYGSERIQHYQIGQKLKNKRIDLEQEIYQDKYIVRDNFAYIILNSFRTASDQEVNNGYYLNDSFEFMKNTLEKISKNKKIKNVVIDISQNGGGNIGAMYRVLGLLTNDDIIAHSHEMQSNAKTTENYKIDANKDGNYNDNDAFDNFNYYILTSKNTFSAANSFSAIVKEMNIGKIIGQKSGGGTSSVLPLVLNDGTSILISSPSTTWYKFDEKEINSEYGVKPDILINYDDFYNLDYLAKNVIGK
ncbi:S41 family peptidase [Mycoplasmopsis arginini]|nr:S41 family peptidase [Mycoplasmopsis arginini]MCY2902999.1 lipoprotein [Mycoplasmopsis arginini QMP CG1-2758]MDI3351001.1 lipoprotein [Mycoplasmopsis arginini]MDI3352682.1 lipoprotein [Mycoplasmopsis arginini]